MTEEVLDRAEAALKANDLAGAERALGQAWPDIAAAPGDAQHLLAQIRLEQGRPDEAEALLQSAARAEPDSLRHRIALGHVRTGLKDPAAAADAYAEALRIDPKWPGLLQAFAVAAYRSGRFAEAERAARQMIAEAPSALAYDTLSAALRGQGKAKEALAAADEGLKLDPAHAPTQHSRGAALLALGKAQEALSIFDALLQRAGSAAVALNRAAALEKLGRGKEAEAAYADAARRWPADPRVQQAIAARRR